MNYKNFGRPCSYKHKHTYIKHKSINLICYESINMDMEVDTGSDLINDKSE